MKFVTWILRLLSTATFVYMCWIVYNQLSGYWDWASPYTFIVTVFRVLSLILFFVTIIVVNGIASIVLGGHMANSLVVGLYNSMTLHFWYLQPYGSHGPLTDVYQVFQVFSTQIFDLAFQLWDDTFTFLYFLFAGIGIAMFLQSLFRMEHKFVGGAFLSIQAILVVAAFRDLPIYGGSPPSGDFISFLTSGMQILAIVSFAYLEFSYQMIYSHSVGKPVEDREETLKKQLLALRSATRRQDTIERGERMSSSTMSRTTGATAFSFLREVIERKIIGSHEALENLDAISDVRRLNIYVDELLVADPSARDELTAKAAAPSSSYVISSTIIGSVIRFLSVVTLSFFLLNPAFLMSLLNLPPGIRNSVELQQPEIVVLFLVPVLLTFAFAAAMITWLSQDRVDAEPKLSREEKRSLRRRRKEIERKMRELEHARRERFKRWRKRKRKPDAEEDEWDRALDEIYKT
ncbi:MAG: hypothetical protein ACTSX2_09460 [Candidatus Thorarchaeota archaeon]